MLEFVTDEQLQELIAYAIKRAKKSDVILKFVIEQRLGKAPQRVELTGEGGGPITIRWQK